MDERREVLVNRMKHLRQEIQSIFDDAYRWNLAHLNEEPIDTDPDGVLRRIVEGLDRSLANEARLAEEGRI